MNRARRARIIPMSAIRDDEFKTANTGIGWRDEDQFFSSIKSAARNFELNRQAPQETYLMLWCETGGMVPQLADAVEEYHVPVYSSGGFDSLTSKHDIAREISGYNRVEILHIGDHDPSGVHLFMSLDEDLQAFIDNYGGDLTVTRLAVTPAQIVEMNLPTAPPKRTDRRSFTGQTTQAEAIRPRDLRRIVIEAIEERMDLDLLEETKEREPEIREHLVSATEDLG